MYTEAEAKEKWCPMVPTTIEGDVRKIPHIHMIGCAGSSCMAWRPGYPKMSEQGEMIPTGYCGLAGAPTR